MGMNENGPLLLFAATERLVFLVAMSRGGGLLVEYLGPGVDSSIVILGDPHIVSLSVIIIPESQSVLSDDCCSRVKLLLWHFCGKLATVECVNGDL